MVRVHLICAEVAIMLIAAPANAINSPTLAGQAMSFGTEALPAGDEEASTVEPAGSEACARAHRSLRIRASMRPSERRAAVMRCTRRQELNAYQPPPAVPGKKALPGEPE